MFILPVCSSLSRLAFAYGHDCLYQLVLATLVCNDCVYLTLGCSTMQTSLVTTESAHTHTSKSLDMLSSTGLDSQTHVQHLKTS